MVAPFAMSPKGTTSARVVPMARAMADAGHEVLVLIPPYDNYAESSNRNMRDGLTIQWLKIPRFSNLLIIGPIILFFVLALKGRRQALSFNPDVIHVFKPKAVSGMIQHLLWIFGSESAIVLDCDDWEGSRGWSELEQYPLVLKWMFDFQERVLIKNNHAVTTASAFLLERVEKLCKDRPVVQIPNFMDSVRHNCWDREVLRRQGRETLDIGANMSVGLLYTRFFEYPIDGYADCIGSFLASDPNALVLVVGKGKFGQEERLAAVLKDRGHIGRVIMLGWVEHNSVPAVLAASDVAMFPAIDNIANKSKCPARLVDLLMSGTPIAAHDVGEAKTYITSGRNGRLLPSGGGDAIGKAAATLLTLHDQRAALEFRESRLGNDLSPTYIAHQLSELYGVALTEKHG